MASIVKRGNSYSVVYMETVGDQRKQKWETYRSLGEAEKRKRLLDLYRDVQTKKRNEPIDTVGHLMERYVLLYGQQKWSFSKFQSNCGLIRNYILPQFGMIRLQELSPLVVAEVYQDFLKYPRINSPNHGETVGPATLKSIHKLLHSAFEQAVLWEYILRNPFHKAALSSIARQKQCFLLPEQIRTLLEQCTESWLSLAIQLAFAGTLRKGELLALTWQDVDWSRNLIHINKTVKRVSREALQTLHKRNVLYEFSPVWSGEKTVLILKSPKTISSNREVYLPETIITALQAFYRTRRTKDSQIPFPELIFCYADGSPIQETTLSKHFHVATAKAGLPKVSFHSLRHSSVTYKLAISGGDIKAVQGDSGHAQAAMITEQYGHILDENRRSIFRQFEEQFYSDLDVNP